MNIRTYADAIRMGQPINQPIQGLTGRIIRGRKPEDFLTLTDDPTRQIVMLFGPDGLQKLAGKNGYDMLVTIGYEPDYIEHKVSQGNQFKMAIFPGSGGPKLATWDNVLEMAAGIYPRVAQRLQRQTKDLCSVPFSQIQQIAGYKFLDIEKLGPNDPRYMTFERYLNSSGDLACTRAFLYYTLHLRELFSGDGYTYESGGARGLQEYIIPNRPLSELGDHAVVDLTVNIPSKGVVMNTATKASTKTLPIPSFYDPQSVREIRQVSYPRVADAAREWRGKYKVQPASTDKAKVALLIVDGQNTFCVPSGELFVSGAPEDNDRLCKFIYNNLAYITGIFPTLDTHTSQQIFHPYFWVNANGDHPLGNQTIISLDDVEKGVWKVNPLVVAQLGGNYASAQRYAHHYVKTLSDGGKYPLLVWTYHGMLGGVGHALVAGLEEACFFHNLVRGSQTGFEIKGGNPLTENYSIFKPEVLTSYDGKPIAQKNTRFIEKLLRYDAVIIGGQAKSHCVAWAINDLLDDIRASDPALVEKVYLLEDCTSPVIVPGVIDFTQQANDAFAKFAAAGMHVVRSTDPIESWPGIQL
jgi:nicotinamidase-related amidase